MMRKREKSVLKVFLKDSTSSLGKSFANSQTQLTVDYLNTQKIELHTNP